MRNNVTINKSQIVEMYPIDKRDYTKTRWSTFNFYASKGDEIFYFFPRLWRKKYYDEDVFSHVLSCALYTRQEMNDILINEENILKECPDELVYENGIIYMKPHVRIQLSNGSKYDIYFNTFDECEKYLEDFRNNNNDFIEI